MAKPSGTNLPKAFQSPRPSLKDGNGGQKNTTLWHEAETQAKPPQGKRGTKRVHHSRTLSKAHRAGAGRRTGKDIIIKAAIARGIHLFPSRTEKLSPAAPMVLRKWESRSPPHKKPGQDASRCPGFPFSLNQSNWTNWGAVRKPGCEQI